MARLCLSCLALAFSVYAPIARAHRLRRVHEQSELDASHVDFADVLDRAISLMDEGISNFLDQKQSKSSLRADGNTAMALLSEMSGNVKALHKVVGKMKKQQRREAAKTQMQLKQLSLAASREKQYQTDLLKLQNFSSQCEQALKRCPSSDVVPGLMPELHQIQNLQRLNDVLREKVASLGTQKSVLQGKIDDLSGDANKTDALKQKIESLEADNQQLQATIQSFTQNEQQKIQEAVSEEIAEVKDKMEDGFAARKRYIKRQEEKIMEKSEDSEEVAQDLQKQNVKLQKSGIHLHVANERLQHENQALRDDKAHLMESMQDLLRQSAEYQQELLKYEKREGCTSPSNKTSAKSKPMPAQCPPCQCSGVSEPFSAEDIAKAAADAAAPMNAPLHSFASNAAADSNDPLEAPVDNGDLSSSSLSKEHKANKYDGDFAVDEPVPVYSPKSPTLDSSAASSPPVVNADVATTSSLEDSLTLPSKLHPKGEVEVRKAEAAMGLKHVTGEKVLAGYLDGEPPPADIQDAARKSQSDVSGAHKMPQMKAAGSALSGPVKAVSVGSKAPADTADASAQLLLKAEKEIAEAGSDA